MDPIERLRSAGRRVADPAEALAQGVAERVVDLVVGALDVDALVARVDPNALLDRVDIDELLARVDVSALAGRVDVNELAQRIDVGALIQRTDLGPVIARTSGGVAGEALDAVRRQVVGLDAFTSRWVGRLLRRGNGGGGAAPARATAAVDSAAADSAAAERGTDAQGLLGRPAGPVSRLAGYAIDLAVVSGAFTLGLAAISYAVTIVTGHALAWQRGSAGVAVAYAAWGFLYLAYPWGVNGKTPGMAVLGVRVVRRGGGSLGARRAVVRAAVFPLSFLFFGLGLAGIVLGREHRALHDLVAGSVVVYSFDSPGSPLAGDAAGPRRADRDDCRGIRTAGHPPRGGDGPAQEMGEIRWEH